MSITIEELSMEDRQVIWICGALERLEGLGAIAAGNSKISDDHIDFYLQLDDKRHELFPDKKELASMTAQFIVADLDMSCERLSKESGTRKTPYDLMGVKTEQEVMNAIRDIIKLVIYYMYDREMIMKYFLEKMVKS